MEHNIIIDKKRHVYSLRGKNVNLIDITGSLSDVWEGKIFSFEDKIYLKKEHKLYFLAEHVVSCFNIVDKTSHQRKFELAENSHLSIKSEIYDIKLLDKVFSPYLDWMSNPREKPVLFLQLENEDFFRVLIEDKNGHIFMSREKTFYLDEHKKLLSWNNRVFYNKIRSNKTFEMMLFQLLFANENYLIFSYFFEGITFAIALRKNGTMKLLGSFPKIHEFPKATLLKLQDSIYHLKKNDFSVITPSCYSDSSYSIDKDGTVVHHYTIECYGAPNISCHDTYRLIDKKYQLVKREDK